MTRLSNRQHPMLRTFAEGGLGWYMPVEDAQKYDQRPFRSMLIQEWVAYRPGRGFHVTKEGLQAWSEFQNTGILRKNEHGPLTKYFDAAAYGLKLVMHSAPSRRSAA